MLSVDGVSSGYGKLQILTDVSISAEPSKVTVIVGPNGSGKSTLLKTIAGLTNIYQGAITFDGTKLSALPSHVIARSGVAYLPQTEGTFTQLKVRENIIMAAYTVPKGEYDQRLKNALQLFPQVEKYMETKVQNLSGGERQMVAMAMALMRNPRLIMFDEPTANLSPKLSSEVLATVKSLATEHHLTVLLVEQNARKALSVADHAAVLELGSIALEGSARDLATDPRVKEAYLGG